MRACACVFVCLCVEVRECGCVCLLLNVVLKFTEEHKSLLNGFNAAFPIGTSYGPGFVPSLSNWNPSEFRSHPFTYIQTTYCLG